MKTILLVDDETSVVESLRLILKDNYKVIGTNSGKEALKILDKERVDLVLLDLKMHEMDGIELLRRLQPSCQETGVVVLTAVNDVKSIVEAVKLGALDYIVKPFEIEEIKITIEKALEFKSLTREVRYLRSEFRYHSIDRLIHGHSRMMEYIIEVVSRVSRVDSTVLLRGESGTGKELVARAIHFDSNRRENPFIVVSCPNLAGDLLETELFGHEKGSFTGAYERRLGKFEIAEGGTIFLDEISEINLPLQAKLLRILQEKEFSRVGSHSVIKTDVRIIAATNKDLEAMIKDGRFREDLYYRINVVPIYLPPLRERIEDIPQLVEHFFNIFRKECHAKTEFISKEAMDALSKYHWPGNVRELKNIMERTIALYGNETTLLPEYLPSEITGISGNLQRVKPNINWRISLEDEVGRVEKHLIEQALQKSGGVKSKAAKLLGTTRRIINYKMQKYGISDSGN
ncbi:MAG: sigma-54-dependent Fis family transcriptional regulator [Candidatus Brocadia sp. AMX2]|uniref:Response regulator containing CheY-like receiver, AAA-type ATPase and DNA-binding domains n=1 Tax=Candidatus Brocadia sinica JPN1 TaxID=1197129 RepID=A0ABQ0JT02_9BACT|nr:MULTISPECIES: sigma-54 dependent transcriptional regulator [Brocadia]KXK30587.1 MAG: two-component response regulator [Candidatus Brocadia sinica]MBC6931639.1 sigma-54-dependent Fis family transcriptional regulator [Candidatus Brocadia sp.]MBL1168996.1 sigma-54-dependent Fis family transcriptional regulator [Candidatus Brocadia sp. AMX1]NOG43431.1 sigma-54-dependent Fis family transcriptional regulator [Planctomycetota bacterium]KAA0245237.1 MAG: sigma-54-dependent Fis family transcriptiona